MLDILESNVGPMMVLLFSCFARQVPNTIFQGIISALLGFSLVLCILGIVFWYRNTWDCRDNAHLAYPKLNQTQMQISLWLNVVLYGLSFVVVSF